MFLDPIECKQATDLLRVDAPLQAAQVLLKATQPGHRRVQQLLIEVQRILIEKGQAFWKEGQKEAAYEHLKVASQCGQLPGEVQQLWNQIEAERRKRQLEEQWQQQRLQQVQELLQEGRLQTAENILQAIPEAETLPIQKDLKIWRERLEAYLRQARECLAAGNYRAAWECYRKAHRVSPRDPAVIALGESLSPSKQPREQPGGESRPICDRETVFALGGLGVVLSASELTVGRPGEEVQLPLWGKLRTRHARLVQNRGRWQIVPYCDSQGVPCHISAAGQKVTGPVILRSGDTIRFGEGGTRWRFVQPVAGSATALLEGDSAGLGSPLIRGSAQRRIILLIDQCILAAEPPAHLIVRDLPCHNLTLRWTAEGLTYEVAGGCASTLLPDGSYAADDPPRVYLPSEIRIEEMLDEAEWLGRMMTSPQTSQDWCLPILPVA